jgi:hypothetical protein
MSEEENVSVEQEAQEVVAQTTDTEPQPKTEATSQKPAKDQQAYNWAEANRKMKELSEQNKEMQEQLRKMQTPPSQNSQDDELDKLADDDIVTKAQAKKMAAKMAREIAQDVIRQRENATVDERLTNKFSDFAAVVTKENIELLKQNEPELALSLASNSDPYTQGIAAYKLLKRVGIGEEVKTSVEKKKAEENSQKPVSINAASKKSAIGNAHLFENGLTKELKSQLWKEMQEARKQA